VDVVSPEEEADAIRELVALLRAGYKAYLESLAKDKQG
jgi:hypothetical protein